MTNGVLDFSSMPAAHVNLPAEPSSSYQRRLPSTHKASSLFSQVKTKEEMRMLLLLRLLRMASFCFCLSSCSQNKSPTKDLTIRVTAATTGRGATQTDDDSRDP